MRKMALIFTAVLAFSPLGIAQAYQQTNLVSDIQGLAQNPPSGQPDAQLVNPWGLVSSSTSPWWVSDNNAGVSTLYDGQGVKQGLVVNIPSPVTGVAGTPTGGGLYRSRGIYVPCEKRAGTRHNDRRSFHVRDRGRNYCGVGSRNQPKRPSQ